MGLGKTLQSISLLAYLRSHHCSGPFLILAPLSVTDGWASELARFSPQLTVLRYVGDKEEREDFRKIICNYVNKQPPPSRSDPALPFDILLTTYELAVLDVKFLSRFRWRYSIIDEAQRLKNPSTVLYQALQEQYMIPRRLLLTGTPVQNNLSELWSLLHFCMPKTFDNVTKFLEAFGSVALAPQDTVDANSLIESDRSKHGLGSLRRILRAFMLRRTKAALVQSKALSLPPLVEVTVFVPLVPVQKKVYISVLRKEMPRIIGGNNGSTSKQFLQNIVIQLRKACSHPYLFDGVEPEPFQEGEHLVQASGKLVILDMLLQRLHSGGHHVLLFAQMTRTLDIIQDYLHFRGYSYERLDGSVRAEERFAAVRSFSGRGREGDSKDGAFIFLLTTRAGGVGLNLVAADTVIFYEQDWNPQADKQALQRAHRIGQLRSVLAINLVTENTIEEVIMQRATAKLQLTQKVVGQVDVDADEQGPANVEKSDLQSMVVFGLHKIISEPDVPEQQTNKILLDDNDGMSKNISVIESALQQRARVSPEDPQKDDITGASVTQLTAQRLNPSHETKKLNPFLREEDDNEKLDLIALKKIENSVENGSNDANAEIKGKRGRRQASPVDEEEVARKKQKKEDRKQSLSNSLGYNSLSVSEPGIAVNNGDQMTEDIEYVHQLVGDCTKPSLARGQTGIVFWCVDNSGTWGNGGVFTSLAGISEKIPEAYESAYEASDLSVGDLHLIPVPGTENSATKSFDELDQSGNHLWVALAVVQTYDRRRKIARSDISLPDLEVCIHKLAASAARLSASVHMPRIHAGSGWYMVERLLRKYATMYQAHFHVYYFKRKPE
ncbi:unnamed protein product [Calypogeia fissa]